MTPVSRSEIVRRFSDLKGNGLAALAVKAAGSAPNSALVDKWIAENERVAPAVKLG